MMLAYHEFSTTSERDVYSIRPEVFRQHMLLVREARGLRACATFDDGHRSQFEFAVPVLGELGLTGLFFITTSWVDRNESTMRWSDLRALVGYGHTIGSHTDTHPLLTACSSADMRREIAISKETLEHHLGVAIDSISMPGGRLNDGILAACAEAGYKRVYTSRAVEHRSASASIPEIVGRYVVHRCVSKRTLAAYLAEDPRMHRWLDIEYSLKKATKALAGDSLYQKLWRGAVRAEIYRTR
jgi:peptidoglycan/xylan/chitin deacetylase (PgdA/CDA1 family)